MRKCAVKVGSYYKVYLVLLNNIFYSFFCFCYHFSKHNRGLSPAWNHPFDEWEFWSSGKDWKSQWQHSEIEKNVEDLHETHRRFRRESQGFGFSQWNQLWTGKGQLISKANFRVFIWTIKQQKYFWISALASKNP